MMNYPTETLDPYDDNGTMVDNVEELRQAVVGHRIVKVEPNTPIKGERDVFWGPQKGLGITLDNGKQVVLADTQDCCAGTDLSNFLLNTDKVDHIITGVGTTDGYTTWHIFADMGDVLALDVSWSCGNPFYYGYGFNIAVQEA